MSGDKIIIAVKWDCLPRSHQGIERTKARAWLIMYWSRDDIQHIEQLNKRCRVHQMKRPRNQKEPLLPYGIPDVSWHKIANNIFNYVTCSYLILVDDYSKSPVSLNLPDHCTFHYGYKESYFPQQPGNCLAPFVTREIKLYTNSWETALNSL